eukprot:SAG11_NODE_6773_length_1251_cov_1.450521_1_plen_148_part_10
MRLTCPCRSLGRTREPPEEGRDVFNERPTKDDLAVVMVRVPACVPAAADDASCSTAVSSECADSRCLQPSAQWWRGLRAAVVTVALRTNQVGLAQTKQLTQPFLSCARAGGDAGEERSQGRHHSHYDGRCALQAVPRGVPPHRRELYC